MIRTALLIVRDEDEGAREDLTAQAIRRALSSGPFVEVDYQVVPDEQAMIRAKLRLYTDGGNVDLVLTAGGIDVGLKERTPEATGEVVERRLPGLAEAMRRAHAEVEPAALLARGVAGVRRQTLVLNLPGSPAGASAALSSVVGVLPLAVRNLSQVSSGFGQ